MVSFYRWKTSDKHATKIGISVPFEEAVFYLAEDEKPFLHSDIQMVKM